MLLDVNRSSGFYIATRILHLAEWHPLEQQG